jgi:hypothetical protein
MDNKAVDNVYSDPLALIVKNMVDALRTDYGSLFTSRFSTPDDVKQLKRRLYLLLRGLDGCDIYRGYALLIKAKPSRVPTVPEILEAAKASRKLRLVKPFVALPRPVSVVKPDFKAIRQAIGGRNG